MRNAFVIIAGIAVAAIVVAAYAAGGGRPGGEASAGGPSMLAGAPAQSFPATRLDGKPGSLEDYRGKVVLLNLWASWCVPCRQEMPDLEHLYAENARRGLVVLGVDQGESAEAAGGFAREHRVTFPILLDEQQRYGRAYAAIGLPTTLVINRAGHIVRGVDGALTFAQMREAVEPLLRAR
jgi:peroxiredoxin